MRELDIIMHKFDIDLARRSPIEIPNIGRDSLQERPVLCSGAEGQGCYNI